MDYLNHNMNRKDRLSRREFLKYSALAVGGLALSGRNTGGRFPLTRLLQQEDPLTPDFPTGVKLGRVCTGNPGSRVPIRSEPYIDAPVVGQAWYDDVFEWKQDVIARQVDPNRVNQRWVEMPEGFVYADDVQEVRHVPQEPLTELPEMPDGERGMWVEIVTPYTRLDLTKPKEHYQFWIRNIDNHDPRLYYSQIYWAFAVRQRPITGDTQYCLMQKFGASPENYWIDARVCRQITPEEIAPIHPEVDNKSIDIRMNGLGVQTLTCYEGTEEVFFTKVTTGGRNPETGRWITPVGKHTPWRKNISMHYSDAEYGFDLPGVPWNYAIEGEGTYIHSTYWHNAFGIMKSNGCVNCRAEDGKWIWRWVAPDIPYYPGDVTWQGYGISTPVTVEVNV